MVPEEKSEVNLIRDPLHIMIHFSLTTLFWLSTNWLLCGQVYISVFILLGMHGASLMCRLTFLKKFHMVFALFLQVFFRSLSLSSPFGNSIMHILELMMSIMRFCSFSFILLAFCSYIVSFQLIYFKGLWFFLLSIQICCGAPLVIFSFKLLNFSTPEFLFCSFFIISISYWYSLFSETPFSYFPLIL